MAKCSVFISSTSEDLKEYREAARDAVFRAGFHPEMMEYFAASPKPPLAECLRKVSPCQLLIVLVAHRYGWVPGDQPNGAAKSITWLECEHAANTKKKDVIAFVLDENAKWALERKESHRAAAAIEDGTDTPDLAAEVKRNIAKLKEFRIWLGTRTQAKFTTPEDLKTKIILALHQWLKEHPECLPDASAELASKIRGHSDPTVYLQQLKRTVHVD